MSFDGEWAQLADGGAVQQREQPDERLVGVTVASGPAAQQACLLAPAQRAATEAARGTVCESDGRVGEADPLLAGELEEVAERRQPETAIASGQEDLDVAPRAGRPVVHAGAVKLGGERGEDREPLLNGVIGQRLLADPPRALPAGEKPRRVSLGRVAQRLRATLDPPRASPLREPAVLVAGEHHASVDEKRLQQPRGVPTAATRTPAV